MSRERVRMDDGTLLVIGYDRGFATWYAIHYDDHDEDAPPRAVIGYHPAEQEILRADRPDAVIGPYPIESAEELILKLIPEHFGLEGEDDQPMCWLCGKPPWQSNPDCDRHPCDRLMR